MGKISLFNITKGTVSGSATGNLFSIPPGCDFLKVLVKSLLNGELINGFKPCDDPLLLSAATVFVPSRRAARALSTAFLGECGTDAVILPKIRMLGDVADEEFGLGDNSTLLADIGGEIGSLDRKLELATLIGKWVDAMSAETRRLFGDEEIFIPSSQADAIKLADDLCLLLSQITQEKIAWSAIQDIAAGDHPEWWRLTTTFLKIIMEAWPEYLEKRGLVDPAQKAALLLEHRARMYAENGSDGPVIIAGSTGSVPSTRSLLEAVSRLPNGAVVLPGLDRYLSDEEWQHIGAADLLRDPALENHPQFGLARLLVHLKTDRANVVDLEVAEFAREERSRLVSLALAASSFTSGWVEKTADLAMQHATDALQQVSLLEAVNERQEALAIAIAMREVLQDPQKTAALVTPDRSLARRVSAELGRFNIDIDDSGGTSLQNTPAVIFLRQIAAVCFSEPDNTSIASMIKNPFCLAGNSSEAAMRNGRQFELVALRGTINTPQAGKFQLCIAAKKTSLQEETYVPDAVRQIDEPAWQELSAHCARLDEILVPVTEAGKGDKPLSLATLFRVLVRAGHELSLNEKKQSVLRNVQGFREFSNLAAEIFASAAGGYEVHPGGFPAILDALLGSIVSRQRYATHPRLHIYGPLEVRLLNHDRVILGGLNEGTWPRTAGNGAFLNRVMRQELGMASAERRTGLAAHDFQQLMGNAEVVLSRSARVDKSPTVASRWLQRLTALAGEDQARAMQNRGNGYISLAVALDQADGRPNRAERPHPAPPAEARPKTLPVTDIETWIRDPYALYAKRVLRLRPLPELEREPDALLKGTLYHAIMEKYSKSGLMQAGTDKRLEGLLAIADMEISAENLPAETALVWKLRFEEIAPEFVKWEEQYHFANSVSETFVEASGGMELANGSFKLTARADRIDVLGDGSLFVLDYKTGSNPTPAQARTFSPQLALEGLIARAGGFGEVPKGDLADLVYVRLRRGSNFKVQQISGKNCTLETIVRSSGSRIEELVRGYQNPEQEYISRMLPFKEGEITGDYDHLARTREWSFGEEGEGDE